MQRLALLSHLLCACAGGTGSDTGEGGGTATVNGDLRLDGGASLSVDPDSTDLQLCASGDNLAVAWVDDRSGTFDVWVNASSDGGETWLDAPISPSSSPGDAHDPSLACSGSDFYLVWEDTRESETQSDGVWFARSSNGGVTWGLPVGLTADSVTTHDANTPHIAVWETGVLLTWAANPGGGYDIYAVASVDGGVSFGAPTRVESDIAGASYSARPKAVLTSSQAMVLYEDRRTGVMTIRGASSNDGGLSFQSDVAISDDADGDALNVDVATEGDVVWLTWHQGPIGERLDAYAARGEGSGGNFSAPVRVSGGNVGERDDLRPRVAVNEGLATVAWYSEIGGGYHVFVRSSADGVTFTDPYRVDNAEDAARSERPSIAGGGGAIVVGWVDDRNSRGSDRRDLYYVTTRDDGTHWAPEERVSRVARGVTIASDLQIGTTGAKAYSAWIDDRLGTPDVFFAVIDVPEPPSPDTGGAR